MFDDLKSLMTALKVLKVWKKTKAQIQEEEKNMNGKSLLGSKMFWFNCLTGAIGIAGTLSESPLAADPKVKGAFLAVTAIGNIILRYVTDQPIDSILPQK